MPDYSPIKITIGIDLDGPLMAPHVAVLGEMKTGCAGLLQWLESQLGLELPSAGFTERVLQYLARLKEADSPKRFYHASLQVDAIGVARQLLSWRDTWYLAGWQGQPLHDASQRLADMAELESLEEPAISLNEGQRLQRVLQALKTHSVPLELTTLDPVSDYPALWQSLLQHLNAHYQAIQPQPIASKESDLGVLQALLLSNEVPAEPIPLQNDGSLLVLHAPSRALSATWLAHYCRNLLPDQADYQLGLVCDGEADDLDLAFAQAGNARLGVSSRSPWRPVFQVLPLAMELIWSPLNPSRLLEFLSHPAGPLPRRIRQPLAECVAESPGMGGSTWNDTIAQLLEAEHHRHDDKQQADKAAQKLQQDLSFWLEHQRYPAYPGTPLDLVKERARAIGDWLAGMLAQAADDPNGSRDVALYQQVQNQVNEFLGAISQLQGQGEQTIDADTLRRLMKSVRGKGAQRPDLESECLPNLAKLAYATSPTACVGEADTVLWWGADQGALPKADGWTAEERTSLRANGINVQALDSRIAWHSASWLRPILAARKQLIVVVHDDLGTHHPVFDQINVVVGPLPSQDLTQCIQGQWKQRLLATSLQGAPQATARDISPLPTPQRCWTLPKSAQLPKRNTESFSSLESFVYGPYLWVLRHTAKLRSGSLLAVSDDNRLKGNLAHRLFEEFFNAHPDIATIATNEIDPWSRKVLPQLIEQLGAVLLLPGRAADRERFIADSTTALLRLVKHLQSAQVVSVAMESRAGGRFVGGELRGSLDLLASKANGDEAVIDIKWGGAKYRRETLRNSRYLQLAVYAELRRQAFGKLPAVGYYVIASQNLIMLSSSYFPSPNSLKAESISLKAESIEPANGESIAEFWLRFEKSWKQRRQQLDKGLIEVNVRGTETRDDLLMDERGLPNEEFYDSFSEFGALVGWGAGQ